VITQLNQLWVTDMRSTASQDIRTHEGWLYIAVVIDLFSRLGEMFAIHDWCIGCLGQNESGLCSLGFFATKPSITHLAESFFQLLKRERIKKKIYSSRTEARSDIFEYIDYDV
jgi:putative transposase